MNETQCPKCNRILSITLTPHSIHYGRLDCKTCGFVGWARNPKSPKNKTAQRFRVGKRSLREVTVFHDFDEEFCFVCLRKKEQLGWNETLTLDHIQELDKDGKDVVENMQILCSACHKFKNWARLYMNWHFQKEEGDDVRPVS